MADRSASAGGPSQQKQRRSSSGTAGGSGGGDGGGGGGGGGQVGSSSKKRKSLPQAEGSNSTQADDSRKKLKSALKSSASASARPSAAQTTLKLAPSVHSGQYAAALTSSAGFELPEGMTFSAEVANLSRSNNASGSSKQRSRLGGDEAALYLSGQDDVMFYHNTNWRPKPLTPDGKRPPADKGYSGQYLIGVRDPNTNTITLHRAPMFTMTRLVSSLQNLSAIKDDSGPSADWSARVAARRDLG
ncbi:unnamed protein product, partial [Tilletia caries]